MKILPRIRGKIGQATDPEEFKGKYFFYIILAELDGTPIGDPIGPFGPFDTEKQAQIELRKVCRKAAEGIEVELTGKVSGKYIDFNNNGALRSWDEH